MRSWKLSGIEPRLSCQRSELRPSLLASNPHFPFGIFVLQLWRKIGRKAWDNFAHDTAAPWCHLEPGSFGRCVLLDARLSLCLVSSWLSNSCINNNNNEEHSIVFFPVFVMSRCHHITCEIIPGFSSPKLRDKIQSGKPGFEPTSLPNN